MTRLTEPSPIELAQGVMEMLAIPMNASLLCWIANSIEAKARAESISFHEASDHIRDQMRTRPAKDGARTLNWRQQRYLEGVLAGSRPGPEHVGGWPAAQLGREGN